MLAVVSMILSIYITFKLLPHVIGLFFSVIAVIAEVLLILFLLPFFGVAIFIIILMVLGLITLLKMLF